MSASTKPDFVLETTINTTPERLWQALTDGDMTRHYFMMDAVLSGKVEKGERYVYTSHNDKPMVQGEFLDVQPHKRLYMTFEPVWSDETRAPAPPSQNLYEIEPVDGGCLLTISHFNITPDTEDVKQGWTMIAAGLKTYLENEKAEA